MQNYAVSHLQHGYGRAALAPEQRVAGVRDEGDGAVAGRAAEGERVAVHLVHEGPVLLAGHARAVEPVLSLQPFL